MTVTEKTRFDYFTVIFVTPTRYRVTYLGSLFSVQGLREFLVDKRMEPEGYSNDTVVTKILGNFWIVNCLSDTFSTGILGIFRQTNRLSEYFVEEFKKTPKVTVKISMWKPK